jgi:50S ribosomal protein L16 3-hydroxylase
MTPKKFTQAALKNGVSLSLRTQMLYQGKQIFINGESFNVGKADKDTLSKLANQRYLNAEDMLTASDDVLEAFCIWYEDGWLEISAR